MGILTLFSNFLAKKFPRARVVWVTLLGHVLLLKNVRSMLLGENELRDYASLIWNWTRNVMLKGAVHFFLQAWLWVTPITHLSDEQIIGNALFYLVWLGLWGHLNYLSTILFRENGAASLILPRFCSLWWSSQSCCSTVWMICSSVPNLPSQLPAE